MPPVALITGGTRGIGRALTAAFATDHEVVATYKRTPPDAHLSQNKSIIAYPADLLDPKTPASLIAEIMGRFGRIDVIINNAGSLLSDDEDQGENMAVNFAAPVALLDAALPHLKAGANVINISSVNAELPAMGAASYSASKAALNTWTRGMAKALGPKGIRVNGVAPGAIERVESPRPAELIEKFVELTALARIGEPEDIAPVVRFLVSDAARFITGEVITVSGGYRL